MDAEEKSELIFLLFSMIWEDMHPCKISFNSFPLFIVISSINENEWHYYLNRFGSGALN